MCAESVADCDAGILPVRTLAILAGYLCLASVSLLMAYPLDSDLRLNLQSRLPVPVLDGNTLEPEFSHHQSRRYLSLKPVPARVRPNWDCRASAVG
jgi:hypothetical protein